MRYISPEEVDRMECFDGNTGLHYNTTLGWWATYRNPLYSKHVASQGWMEVA